MLCGRADCAVAQAFAIVGGQQYLRCGEKSRIIFRGLVGYELGYAVHYGHGAFFQLNHGNGKAIDM